MDATRLRAEICDFTPTANGKTFQYTIAVAFGKIKWSVNRRFSDFVALQTQLLENDHLAGILGLPSKTLIGRPQGSAELRQRQNELEVFLHGLLARPDIRTSNALLKFLDFETHTHIAVRHLSPSCVANTNPSQLSISSFQILSDGFVAIGYEDASSLSRLGRVWQVVEPDEVGCLSLWQYSVETGFTRLTGSTKPSKVRAMHFHEASRRLFVGMDSGIVEIYDIPQLENIRGKSSSNKLSNSASPSERRQQHVESPSSVVKDLFSEPLAQLKAHEGAVIAFHGGENELLSTGFDGSFRVVSLRKGKILSGGRLSQRLGEAKITSCYFDEDELRAFIGTSAGQVLIYSTEEQPPTFLHSIVPVNATSCVMSISMTENTLLVGAGELVVAYGFPNRGEEKRMPRLGEFASPLSDGRSVRSVTAWPSRRWMIVSHEDAVCVWDLRTGMSISAFQYWGGMSQAILLKRDCAMAAQTGVAMSEEDGDDCVVFGGSSGSMQIWKFAAWSEYVTWHHEPNTNDGRSQRKLTESSCDNKRTDLKNSDVKNSDVKNSDFKRGGDVKNSDFKRGGDVKNGDVRSSVWRSNKDINSGHDRMHYDDRSPHVGSHSGLSDGNSSDNDDLHDVLATSQW